MLYCPSQNIQLLGINVCLLSHYKHLENEGDSSSSDNDLGSDLTDTSELAQPLTE
jgi:hypothetical protein